jgi:large subunit ribosomal protein L17
MRHQKKGFKLGRTASHRKATLAALSNALIAHKRIKTTHVKAKALRQFVEPLITRSKEDTTHNRRQVFRHLQDKESVKELYGVIAERVATRPGGYTRIVKLGQRPGDGTEMAVIELVDFNATPEQEVTTTRRRRRTRRSSGSSSDAPTASSKPAAKETKREPANEAVPSPENHADSAAPEQTSEASAQAPGTPLTAPEETAGGQATNPEAGSEGTGQSGTTGSQKA